MIIWRPKNVIFERFWPFSKFHFPACNTLVILETFLTLQNYNGTKRVPFPQYKYIVPE